MNKQKLINKTSTRWGLSDLKELDSVHNHVFSCIRHGLPVILKLSKDRNALKREVAALKAFAGYGAVKMIEEQEEAILLEKISGNSLKTYFPERDKEAIHITAQIIKALHNAPVLHNFPHIKDWVSVLDKEWGIPHLTKAKALRDELLVSSNKDELLHGDLHHNNILKNGNGWVVIDPKGVIGPAEYEVAAFIRNPIPELLDLANACDIIEMRISEFATNLGYDPTRIKKWCFVQAVLCWIWALEDRTNAEYFEKLTKVIDLMV